MAKQQHQNDVQNSCHSDILFSMLIRSLVPSQMTQQKSQARTIQSHHQGWSWLRCKACSLWQVWWSMLQAVPWQPVSAWTQTLCGRLWQTLMSTLSWWAQVRGVCIFMVLSEDLHLNGLPQSKRFSLAWWLRQWLRAEDPGFDSHLCHGDFCRSLYQWLKNWHSSGTLLGAWWYRVSAGTGWLGVSILSLGEVESLICNFYLSLSRSIPEIH